MRGVLAEDKREEEERELTFLKVNGIFMEICWLNGFVVWEIILRWHTFNPFLYPSFSFSFSFSLFNHKRSHIGFSVQKRAQKKWVTIFGLAQ